MFNKKNVELVDLKQSPIIKITKRGIKTNKGEYILDKIIFATGFDALTGSILKLNITGKKGINLSKFWSKGPKSFLGLLVPNFPNLFIVSGPGSPSVLTNVPVQIEQHVNWITNCIKYLEKIEKKVLKLPILQQKNGKKKL